MVGPVGTEVRRMINSSFVTTAFALGDILISLIGAAPFFPRPPQSAGRSRVIGLQGAGEERGRGDPCVMYMQ